MLTKGVLTHDWHKIDTRNWTPCRIRQRAKTLRLALALQRTARRLATLRSWTEVLQEPISLTRAHPRLAPACARLLLGLERPLHLEVGRGHRPARPAGNGVRSLVQLGRGRPDPLHDQRPTCCSQFGHQAQICFCISFIWATSSRRYSGRGGTRSAGKGVSLPKPARSADTGRRPLRCVPLDAPGLGRRGRRSVESAKPRNRGPNQGRGRFT
jgi:hypothetical protein